MRAANLAKYNSGESEDDDVAIYVSAGDGGKTFEPAPEGLHPSVCVDVVDRGILETEYGPKHKLDIIWQVVPTNDDGTEQRDSEGRRWQAMQRYTASLNEKSRLYAQLKAWRGKAFTKDELQRFDVESLVGACCQLQIAHNMASNGKVYGNVQAIVPLGKGMPKLKPHEYTRLKDRVQQGNGMTPPPSDDDLPF